MINGVEISRLSIGEIYLITGVEKNKYKVKKIEQKPRLFFQCNKYLDWEFIDILTGNKYIRYGSHIHHAGNVIVHIRFPLTAIGSNIPTEVKWKRAYEAAEKIAGVEMPRKDKPKLKTIFK